MNRVLAHYSGASPGGLQHTPSKDDPIYLVQDPAYLRSGPLSNEPTSNTRLRKPDIIGTSIAHIASLWGGRLTASAPFDKWKQNLITSRVRWKEIRSQKHSQWDDCWNVWELKLQTSFPDVQYPSFELKAVLGLSESIFFWHHHSGKANLR